MAPIDRSCSNATSQPNMYIEKFNISRLRLCITDVAASEKNYLITTCSGGCPPKREYILIFFTSAKGTNRQILLKRNFPALQTAPV